MIISLKMDESLLARIDATALEDGETRSASIRRYLGAMLAWRRDKAVWSQAQERGAADGLGPHAALFGLITASLQVVQQSRRAAIACPPQTVVAPRRQG